MSVAQAGNYTLWLRLGRAAPGAPASGRVHVSLRQRGIERASQELDPHAPDALATPKVRQEDFVWQRASVGLEPGEVTLVLSQASAPGAPPTTPIVDCALLTTDGDYRPDYRDFNGQIYLRVHVDHSATPSAPFVNRVTTGRQDHGPFIKPLSEGETSPWLNVTRWFSGANEAHWNVVAGRPPAALEYTVQFATRPDAEHVVRDIHVNRPGRIVFLLPSELSAKAVPRADFELAEDRAREVESWPKVAFGHRPQLFPLLTNLDAESPGSPVEKRVLALAGLNGFTGVLSDSDVAQGFVFSRVYNSAYLFLPAGHIAPDFPKIDKTLTANAALVRASGHSASVQHLKLIDEASAMRLSQLAEHEENQNAFKSWLREHHFDPFSPSDRKRLAASGTSASIAIQTERDTELPGLYYYSQRFRAHLVAHAFGQLSDRVHALYPQGVRSAQNMSDGAVVYANMYAQGNDYFEYFKDGNLDVALSEDWTNGAATRQLCGWNVALLRAATKYRHQPIHMYDIAYSTRTPVEVKLKALSDLAQGAKLLLFYDYAPRYITETHGWAEMPLTIAAISELTREIGAAEEQLVSAMPPPAKTAILYSTAQDIWTAGYDIAQGNERQFTYLALRHAHVAVDVLSEDDVLSGKLDGYQTLYVHGEQLDHRLVPLLAKWVRRGGSIVLSPGAGSRDEWNRPSTGLDHELDLHRQPLQVVEHTLASSFGLRSWKGQAAEVSIASGGTARALFVEQHFEPHDGDQSLAHFADASSAAVRRRVGAGRVTAFGFLPATDYVRRAAVDYYDSQETTILPGYLKQIAQHQGAASTRPRIDVYGAAPPDYPADLRAFIVQEALDAGPQPVEVDKPLVEATLLEGPAGWVVPLANYGRPEHEITVKVRPSRRCGAVRSSHSGELTSADEPDGSLLVRLPLETTDFVFASCAK